MNVTEIVLGSALAALLLLLAGYYAWRQKRILASLGPDDPAWNPEDRVYIRKQAIRRLWCSGLMVIFAFMLVGSFFLEQARPEANPNQQDAPEQKEYLWQVTIYWMVALLLLFAIVTLAALDIVAISRFAHRKTRQLEADRQAIIESHAARYRKDRNGEG